MRFRLKFNSFCSPMTIWFLQHYLLNKLSFLYWVTSDFLRPGGLQQARSFCPPLSCRVCSHVRWVSDAVQPSHPLLPPPLFPLNLSQHQGLFQWVGSSYQEAKVLVSAPVLPMSIQGWFPFKTDWFDHLVFQGTLSSLLQHHSSKASILQCSTFITVQLSQPYSPWGASVYY